MTTDDERTTLTRGQLASLTALLFVSNDGRIHDAEDHYGTLTEAQAAEMFGVSAAEWSELIEIVKMSRSVFAKKPDYRY